MLNLSSSSNNNDLRRFSLTAVREIGEFKEPKANNMGLTRHNQTCELCFLFVPLSGTVLKCQYCNVVCHKECLRKYKDQKYSLDETTPIWTCFYCVDSLQYDKKYRETQMRERNRVLRFDESQIIIAKNWRRYFQRRKYLRIYQAIIQLQIHFQIRKQKRKFVNSVQNKLRTIKLRIHSLQNVFLFDRDSKASFVDATNNSHSINNNQYRFKKKEHQIYLIISVKDNNTKRGVFDDYAAHSWRIESPIIPVEILPNGTIDVNIDEKFVLGGVSGFQTVLITLFQKSFINNGRDIFLGQLAIDLSIKNLWKTGGKFNKIAFHDYKHEVKDSLGIQPLKLDFSFYDKFHDLKCFNKPITISYDLQTTHNMNAECGYCIGTSIEEIIKDLSKLPDTTGFIFPNKKLLQAGHQMKILNSAPSSRRPSLSNSIDNLNTTFSSSSSSGSEMTSSSSTTFTTHTMKKLWLSIADGKIYLFGYFGDPLKLIIDLQYFSVSFDFTSIPKGPGQQPPSIIPTPQPLSPQQISLNEKNNNVIYKLYRMGYPEFHFYPCKESDIFPIKCAFLTSLRYSKRFFPNANPFTYEETNNGRSSPDGVPPPSRNGKEKFDISFLLNDILSLEILRNKRNALKEAIILSTLPSNSHTTSVPTLPISSPLLSQQNPAFNTPRAPSPFAEFESDCLFTTAIPCRSVQLEPLSPQLSGQLLSNEGPPPQDSSLNKKTNSNTQMNTSRTSFSVDPQLPPTSKKHLQPLKHIPNGKRSSVDATMTDKNIADLLKKVSTSSSGVDVSRHKTQRRTSIAMDPTKNNISSKSKVNLLAKSDSSSLSTARRYSLSGLEDIQEDSNQRKIHFAEKDEFLFKSSQDDGDLPLTSTGSLKRSNSFQKRQQEKQKSNELFLPALNDPRSSEKQLLSKPPLSSSGTNRNSKKKKDQAPNLLSNSYLDDDPILDLLNDTQRSIYLSIVSKLEQQKSQLTDALKQQIIEQMSLEDVVIDQKYQNVGQSFIERLFSKLSEHQIQTHNFHSHHLTETKDYEILPHSLI